MVAIVLVVAVVLRLAKERSKVQRVEAAEIRWDGQKPVSSGFDDVLEGWEFVATMNQHTPLWILEKHGESHPGPPEDLPEYGGQEHGIWVPVTKGWEELGIEADEVEGSMMASMVGQIPSDGGDFLPFLKETRRIVEGEGDEESKLEKVEALGEQSPVWKEYLERLPPDIFVPWDEV